MLISDYEKVGKESERECKEFQITINGEPLETSLKATMIVKEDASVTSSSDIMQSQ